MAAATSSLIINSVHSISLVWTTEMGEKHALIEARHMSAPGTKQTNGNEQFAMSEKRTRI